MTLVLGQIELPDQTLQIEHLNINTDQTKTYNHKVYLMSSSYSQWDKNSPSLCQIKSEARTTLSLKILDLRGRLINAANGCPFRLTLVQLKENNNITHFNQCALINWDYEEVDVQAGDSPMVLNVTFKREHFQGEGKTWLVAEGKVVLDNIISILH